MNSKSWACLVCAVFVSCGAAGSGTDGGSGGSGGTGGRGGSNGAFELYATFNHGVEDSYARDASVYVLPSEPQDIQVQGFLAGGLAELSFKTKTLSDGGYSCSSVNYALEPGRGWYALGTDGKCTVVLTSVGANAGEVTVGTFSASLTPGSSFTDGGLPVLSGRFRFTRE